ncbi:hypothetical protein Vretimale_10473 [Volvox reticuliferus]|nr:hypothetical protein Vretifemale_12491 [Volvox reticuliferus]GIM06199.1 hypothetical protein Vretimale_10473 [Volvox reticuliferus]
MQTPPAFPAQPIPQPTLGYPPPGAGHEVPPAPSSPSPASPDALVVTVPHLPSALTHTTGIQDLLPNQNQPASTIPTPPSGHNPGDGISPPASPIIISPPLSAASLATPGAPPAFPPPSTTSMFADPDNHPTATGTKSPEHDQMVKPPPMPPTTHQQRSTSPCKLPPVPSSVPWVTAPANKAPVASARGWLSRCLRRIFNRVRGEESGVGAALTPGGSAAIGNKSPQRWSGGVGRCGRRTSCGRNVEEHGESNKARKIKAILQQAALLPLARRHELLAMAEKLHPELAPAFLEDNRAAKDTNAGIPAAVNDMEPVPGLEAKLKELAQLVMKSSQLPAAPTALATSHAAATPQIASAAAKTSKDIGGPAMEAAEGAVAAEGAEAQPGDVLSVSVIPEYDQYGLDAQTVRAVVSIKAITEVPKRARVALTCVLDRSGSMAGSLIRLVQKTCHFLIDQLNDDDFLGLISYSGDVREDLPLIRMTTAARTVAHAVVEELVATDSTALYDGLVAGVRQQMEAETELGSCGGGGGGGGATGSLSLSSLPASQLVHSCFLFTDGEATDGPRTPADIISGLRQLQEPSGQNVTVHTFGFGAGHSVELLQAVAEAQGGMYYYVKSTDDIASAFGDALGGLLAVVAKAVRVEVRTHPGVTLTAFRSGGRVIGASSPSFTPSTATIASANITSRTASVPTGAIFNDMFAEETRECLIVLEIPSSPPAASELVFVDLQFTDVASGQRVKRTTELRVCRNAVPRPVGQLPAELVFVTAARFETLDAIEAAQRAAAARGGDVEHAHRLLDTQLKRLQSAPLKGPKLTALADQTRLAKLSIRPKTRADQRSVAAMAGTVQVLKQQRAAISTVSTMQCYEQYDLKSKRAVRLRASKMVSDWP